MIENQFHILEEAQKYVSDLILTKVNKSITFHTLQHTQEVVAACEKMAGYYHLEDEDWFALSLAAWFHDTGYSSGQAKNHENVSIELAKEFINKHQIEQPVLDKVIGCINATRLPQNPTHLIEQIMCDADLFHLGTEEFKEKNRLLRKELNEFGGLGISKKEWRKKNVEFLEKHHYFTTYCIQNLQPLKEIYLAEIKQKLNGNEKPVKKEKAIEKKKGLSDDEMKKAAELKKKKEKESQSERAIATVFRIMAQNQANLGQMADTKSNILISVNAIILSFLIGTLFDKLLGDPYLQIPVTILVLVCVLSIVFSILATRPTVSSGTFTKEDIADKKTNLLFFGNFHKMNLPDYEWGMTEMLGDKVYLYSSMIKDNYFLGVVLAKKYRYLRVAYNIFMFGLITAMIAFAIAFILPDATEIYTQG
ncbi:MAG TPA: Pycsar system effector family protein [Chitinophagaceae bacterium]|nr:Pycsar system effector family protein [Chitinophagaceae bacterium]